MSAPRGRMKSLSALREAFAYQTALVASINHITSHIPERIVTGFKELEDPTGPVSDALDRLGIMDHVIAATVLPPSIPGARIVGPALTVRQIRTRAAQGAGEDSAPPLAPMAVHLHASPGDVVVIESCGGASSGGGYAQYLGQRHGEVGAIIDGAVRDLGQSRRLGYPLWVREITPVTGKGRISTVEINGAVTIAGVHVAAGDLVVADDSGICFVPVEHAETVLSLCQKIVRDDFDVYGF
ncbi:MAG TPA: RraA family protein [Chloroflexota bacterium]|nr:RraA family protein [Chloroflexota bacterium]